jgi:hypothetical protein
VKKLTTETGAGQWGTALAFACALFGLECEVWQVGGVLRPEALPRMMIEAFGGTVHRSPSTSPRPGGDPGRPTRDHPGSLGIAISEAVEVAAQDPDTRYALGSVLNHVLLHQTIIGEEALLQLAKAGEDPRPHRRLHRRRLELRRAVLPVPAREAGRADLPEIRAVEPASCPSLTQGTYAYDFGDTAGMTPLMKMHTLGHDFVPDPIHAGGLRYHGMSPLISHVYELGLIDRDGRPADRVLRRRRAVRPHRGDRPGARADPRARRGIREARWRARRPARRRSSSPRCAGTATSTSPAYDAYLRWPSCPAWSTRVMDEAPLRRGAASANARWDNTVAILTGDFLFARASDLPPTSAPRPCGIQARTFERLCTGQIRETVGPADGRGPDRPPPRGARGKTGSLIATAGRFGRHDFSGAPVEVVGRWRRTARRSAWPSSSPTTCSTSPASAQSGKTPGTDLREGVATLPVLHARASTDPADARLRELTAGPIHDDAEHAEALALLRAHPAIGLARAEAHRWADDARASLVVLPAGPAREALELLCDYVVDRTG